MQTQYSFNSGLKWIYPYENADASIFPFRSLNTSSLINDLFDSHLLVLHGDNGSGKTSFIQAQLIPALELAGSKCITIRSINDPLHEIIANILDRPLNKFTEDIYDFELSKIINQDFDKNQRDWVLIIDPCDNLLFSKNRSVCENLFTELNNILKSQISAGRQNFHLVFSLRSDFLPDLLTFTPDFPLLDSAPRYHLDHLNESEISSFIKTFSRITNIQLSQELKDHLLSSYQKLKLRTFDFQVIICHIYNEVENLHGNAVGTAYIEFTLDQFLQLTSVPLIIRDFLNNEIEKIVDDIQSKHYPAQSIVTIQPNNLTTLRLESLLRRCIRLILFCFISTRKSALTTSCRAIIYQVLKDQSGISKKVVYRAILSLTKHGFIKKVPENSNLLELSNASLVVPILNWVDSSIDIQDMIDAHLRFSHIYSECISQNRYMSVDELGETAKSSDRLGFSTQELILIFKSSLATAYQTKKWFERMKAEFLSTHEIINSEKNKAEFHKRIMLVKSLFKIGPEVVSFLHNFLKDEYPQVRSHTVGALDRLDPAGEWRQYLIFESFVNEGTFLMGTNEGNFADEGPQHTINLDEYYIGLTPITFSDFKLYMDDIEEPFDITPGMERHPISGLTWFQIQEYARWASLRLPTEPEWEKAASWNDRNKTKRQYPWGDVFEETRCNMRAAKLNTTTPVGRYSPSGDSSYGNKDMAGNIWEWTNSIFLPYPYNNHDGREEKSKSGSRVIRGGSYECGATYVTCTVRLAFDPYSSRADLGFRTVLQIPDTKDW